MIIFTATLFFILNTLLLIKAIKKKRKSNLIKVYISLLVFTLISSLALIIKLILIKFNINNLFVLEPFIYLSTYMVPVCLFIITTIFTSRLKINYKKLSLLYIPSILIMLCIMTNNLHHLFFAEYATIETDVVFGIIYKYANLYCYIIYTSIIIMFIYSSFKYIGKLPVECISFCSILSTFLILDPMTKYILRDAHFCTTPYLISIFTLSLYYIIIKHENITYLAFDSQFIIDTISSPIVLIDKVGNITAMNLAFKNTIESIYKGKEHSNNFYEIVKEISSPHYNLLKALVQTSIVKKHPITKEFSFSFKKHTYNYLLNLSTVTWQRIKTPWRKFVRTKHTSTLLMFKSLDSIKEEKSNIDDSKNAIDIQSKFATVGELAAGVAHDINTPITSIKTAISILRSYGLKEEEKIALNQMEKSANRITEVSTSIRDQFRNMGFAKKEMFSFNLLVSNLINMTRNTLERKNIRLYLDVDPDVLLYGVPAKLTQVLLNIINNSIAAYDSLPNKQEGIIIFKAYKGKKNLVITIEDYAGGIPKNIRPYIFKNILNTKGAKGFGLGLYICNLIIREDFEGKITSVCKDNSTSIKISIPLITDKFTIHK